MIGYVYILGTILLTVYGQVIVKWQLGNVGTLPSGRMAKLYFVIELVSNPWIVSSLFAAFLAFLFWVAALSKFDLSYAYPFMSVAFLLVLILSRIIFQEAITIPKILGVALIMAGIIVGSQR